MFSTKSRLRVLVAGFAFGVLTSTAASSLAQSTTLDSFRPAPLAGDGFATNSTETEGRLRLGGQLYLDYANDPLVYERNLGGSSGGDLRIVSHQLVLHGFVTLTIVDRVVAFIGIPVNAVMNGESPGARPIFPADGASLGDMQAGARVLLFGDAGEGFSLAAQGAIFFPTSRFGGDNHYAGDETVRLHAQANAQYRLAPVRLVANLGAMFRGRQDIGGGLDIGQQLTFGLGAMVPLLDEQLAVVADFHGTTTFNDFFDREQTNLELLVGGRYFHASGVSVGVGGGPGLSHGYGTPDVRVLATVGFSRELEDGTTASSDRDGDGIADERDGCPDAAEDVDSFEDENGCPDPDNDADGVLDAADACVNEPEDVDSFEDENGCPDPDNDADGILDAADACPVEPEDVDSFEDENGCPDRDNDADEIPDVDDQCPLVPGHRRNHGCPDPDRDGDTVIDRLDNCPDEPGTVENQGCAATQQVRIEAGRLVIMDTVYFRTNSDVIQPRSFGLLDNVARVIVAHPEILHVRVQGHTDSRGNHDRNVRLSQARADSVMRYLVSKGVEATRLTAHGFGPDMPIVPNARTPADHARNRRVEFEIADDVAPTESAPAATP